MVFLNIKSFFKRLDELKIFVGGHSPHISVCLNKTRLSQDSDNELLTTEGFHKISRKDRTRYGGGVSIYLKNHSVQARELGGKFFKRIENLVRTDRIGEQGLYTHVGPEL